MTEITGRKILRTEQILGLRQFNLTHYHSLQYTSKGLARKEKIEEVLRENLAKIEEYGRSGDVPDELQPVLRRLWVSTRDAHATVSYDILRIKTYLDEREENDDLHK